MADGWLYTQSSTRVELRTDGTLHFIDPDGSERVLTAEEAAGDAG